MCEALDRLSCGVVVRDAGRRIVYANSEAYRLLEWPSTLKLIGRTTIKRRGFQIDAVDGPRYRRPAYRVLETGQVIRGGRYRLVLSTGELRWLKADFVPIFDAQGRVSHVLTNMVDITEAERLRKLQWWLREEAFQVVSGAALVLRNRGKKGPADDGSEDMDYLATLLHQLAGQLRTIDRMQIAASIT